MLSKTVGRGLKASILIHLFAILHEQNIKQCLKFSMYLNKVIKVDNIVIQEKRKKTRCRRECVILFNENIVQIGKQVKRRVIRISGPGLKYQQMENNIS